MWFFSPPLGNINCFMEVTLEAYKTTKHSANLEVCGKKIHPGSAESLRFTTFWRKWAVKTPKSACFAFCLRAKLYEFIHISWTLFFNCCIMSWKAGIWSLLWCETGAPPELPLDVLLPCSQTGSVDEAPRGHQASPQTIFKLAPKRESLFNLSKPKCIH